MSPLFDAASQGETASGTSLTVPHTCSGNDRVLLVAMDVFHDAAGTVITGVTYAGVAMRRLELVRIYNAVPDSALYLFALMNPAVGTNNIVVSASPAQEIDLAAASWNMCGGLGVPVGRAVTPTTSISVEVSANPNDVIVDAFANFVGDSGTVTIGANQTAVSVNDNGSGLDSIRMSSQSGQNGGTMSWSWVNSDQSALIAVPLLPLSNDKPSGRNRNLDLMLMEDSDEGPFDDLDVRNWF